MKEGRRKLRRSKSIARSIYVSYMKQFIIFFLLTMILTLCVWMSIHINLSIDKLRDNSYRLVSLLNINSNDFYNEISSIKDNGINEIYIYTPQNSTEAIYETVTNGLSFEYYSRLDKFDKFKEFILSGDIFYDMRIHIDNKEFYLVYKSDLHSFLTQDNVYSSFIVLLVYSNILLILGLIIFFIYGAYRTKVVLKPLRDMTLIAKDLNLNNKNLRFDIESAQYELKELGSTINEMLDRIQIEYIKQKRFVSDVSHELRTPISVIDGYANMLKRWGSEDKEALEKSINAIINESANMKKLVDNLLILARFDNKTLKFEQSEIDVKDILNEVLNETKMIDKELHNISGEIGDKLTIKGDRSRIKQAIRIFVDNSLKYTLPNGEIKIESYKNNNDVVIKIHDQGTGISSKDMGNIFKRFYRGDISRNRHTGGYGLGLSIARIIINGHNGKITVLSKEGKGTTIELRLPAYS